MNCGNKFIVNSMYLFASCAESVLWQDQVFVHYVYMYKTMTGKTKNNYQKPIFENHFPVFDWPSTFGVEGQSNIFLILHWFGNKVIKNKKSWSRVARTHLFWQKWNYRLIIELNNIFNIEVTLESSFLRQHYWYQRIMMHGSGNIPLKMLLFAVFLTMFTHNQTMKISLPEQPVNKHTGPSLTSMGMLLNVSASYSLISASMSVHAWM